MFSRIFLIVFGLVLHVTALAQNPYQACSTQFAHEQAPKIISLPFTRLTSLCYSEMAILYSGQTRTPLYVAEVLTRDRVEAGKALSREDNFHEELRLPADDRATLQDYKGSMREQLQRGHMAPNKDFSNRQSQYESFSLANIIPQNGDNNEGVWSDIEQRVRGMAMQRGQVFVVTGPIFSNASTRLKGRVLIPQRIFKAIYDPAKQTAAAYVVNNAEGNEYQVVSLEELEKLTGLTIFPSLSQRAKQTAMELPVIKPKRKRSAPTSRAWF